MQTIYHARTDWYVSDAAKTESELTAGWYRDWDLRWDISEVAQSVARLI
jgi:hypothetical protein